MRANFYFVIKSIDFITESIGRIASWLLLMLILLTCYDVAMRYMFQQGAIALQELEWHLFALIFLLGAAYTLKHDEHVRVDIIYQSRFITDKQRAIINILGTLCLLLPFCILILVTTWPFVLNAYYYHEGSPDPGGLPYRFLLKGSVLLAFSLLIIQGVAEILRHILTLTNTQEGH